MLFDYSKTFSPGKLGVLATFTGYVNCDGLPGYVPGGVVLWVVRVCVRVCFVLKESGGYVFHHFKYDWLRVTLVQI